MLSVCEMRRTLACIALIGLTGLLAGCGSAISTDAATKNALETRVALTPTIVATASNAPIPSDVPTVARIPAPSATPTATDTPVPGIAPTITPTLVPATATRVSPAQATVSGKPFDALTASDWAQLTAAAREQYIRGELVRRNCAKMDSATVSTLVGWLAGSANAGISPQQGFDNFVNSLGC